jgi:endonuclease/exonuclease/phosphatase family metal-dependent hydrolase
MPCHNILSCVALLTLLTLAPARGETITVATYNIEHFESHFEGHRLRKLAPTATTRPSGAAGDTTPAEPADPPPTPEQAEKFALSGTGDATKPQDVNLKDVIADLKHQNDEDNWEVAEVITDERFNPDVLVIEEGCSQENLEYFNERWLKNAYKTVMTFPTNTTRNQHLCMLLKPGFKVIEKRDKYYLEKDPAQNDRGDRLFARGPAFVLIETPGGYRFWVGVTHQKSKSGNNLEVTKWRLRESARTHQIMQDLRKTGPADVMLLGDMNDDFGLDEFEKEIGTDAIATLVGPKQDGFLLATQPLIDAKENSFGGYWNPKFRSLIDHVVTTPEMKDQIEDVKVFKLNVARVASDHYPVYVKVKCDAPAAKQ